jgi:hypothetical protein
MSEERPAFGERLENLVKLGAIEFWPEPLDNGVERRLNDDLGSTILSELR